MTLNKAQLIEVPGGPGVVGGIVAGNNVTISPDGSLNGPPSGTTKIIAGTNITVSPASGTGDVTITYNGPVPPGDFPVGTRMPFVQAAAPTGWTRLTDGDNSAYRIVSGTGGALGGTINFTDVFQSQSWSGSTSLSLSASGSVNNASVTTGGGNVSVSGSVAGATLSVGQNASHQHNSGPGMCIGQSSPANTTQGGAINNGSTYATDTRGSSSSHTHSYSPGSSSFTSGTSQHNHPITFSGSAPAATVNGNPINLAVKYVNSINCVKS